MTLEIDLTDDGRGLAPCPSKERPENKQGCVYVVNVCWWDVRVVRE